MRMGFGVGYEPQEEVGAGRQRSAMVVNHRIDGASSAHKTNSAPKPLTFRGFLMDSTGEYK